MGTYLIPRDLKGEGRILFFSYKALVYTIIGAIPGYLLFLVIKPINIWAAWIALGVLAFIGFSIGTFAMPNTKSFEVTRKTGGEKIDEIIVRYVKFRMKKNRIYIYEKKEEENKWVA